MNRLLLSLVAFALLLRLIVCLRMPTSDASLATLPDQLEYLQSGRNLLQGQGMSFVDPRFNQRVFAYRMPGYPLVIAACGGKVVAVRVVQCLLDASTVAAIYLLARRWLTPGVSLAAAAWVAINPFQIYFCGLILSETLFIALLVWGMELLLPCPVLGERAGVRVFDLFYSVTRKQTTRKPSPQPSPRVQGEGGAVGALLVCASALVRPSAMLLPILLPLSMGRRRLLIVAITIEAALLSVWAIRNHAVVGEWVFTTTNSGISAYDGLNAHATGASDQRFIADMPELQAMTETQRNQHLGKLANDFAIHHPLDVIKLAGTKLARFWSPIPLSAEYGSNPKLIAISLVYSLPLDLLILIGLLSGKLPRNAKRWLLVPAVYFSAVHAVGVGSLRYRIPADVPMTIIAASGAAACFGGRKLYGQPPADT